MKAAKRKKLEAAGFAFGDAADFLGLSDQERALVEAKASLASLLVERRLAESITQKELAERISSSQSRVAKMEAAEASVSLDLLIRGLTALGVSLKDIGKTLRAAA